MKKLLAVVIMLFSVSAFAADKIYTLNKDAFLTVDKHHYFTDKSKNGKPITGIVKAYNEDGVLYAEYSVKNGFQDGFERAYYDKDKLVMEATYKNGVQDGPFKSYYPSGKLESESIYKNGMRDGITKFYFENGKLSSETSYKNNNKNGVEKFYYEDGKVKAEYNYSNDMLLNGYCMIDGKKKVMNDKEISEWNLEKKRVCK